MYYLFLAEGFEEVEALTPLDYLRRAGVKILSVGVTGEYVTGAHGITVKTDIPLSDVKIGDDLEGIILPGGMPGTKNLEASMDLSKLLIYANAHGRLIGAICAAPSIPGKLGLLDSKKATCYPGFENTLKMALPQTDKVVTDGNIITSRGAGTANEFAFALIAYIKGKNAAEQIAEGVIFR